MMSKRNRQYLGIITAVIAYYIIHEGAHLMVALCLGVFKTINFMGMGVQIDVHHTLMTDTQMGFFCLAGPMASLVFAYVLVAFTDVICQNKNILFRALFYYVTITMLMLDPLYLSFIYKFVGGGDMNGISLLIPETMVQCIFGTLVVINFFVFWKIVLPKYIKAQECYC